MPSIELTVCSTEIKVSEDPIYLMRAARIFSPSYHKGDVSQCSVITHVNLPYVYMFVHFCRSPPFLTSFTPTLLPLYRTALRKQNKSRQKLLRHRKSQSIDNVEAEHRVHS